MRSLGQNRPLQQNTILAVARINPNFDPDSTTDLHKTYFILFFKCSDVGFIESAYDSTCDKDQFESSKIVNIKFSIKQSIITHNFF